MDRAFAVFEVKSIDEDKGIITGIATTPQPDRVGDIVEPKGAQFKLPLPLLWQHDSDAPIGHVTAAKVTAKGIEIVAQIAREVLPEIDRAWTLIKAGLVRGLSIGFRPLKDGVELINPKDPFSALRFVAWEWLELSAVTIPANAQASIQTIKAYDEATRAASGKSASPSVVRLTHSPGVSGANQSLTKGHSMNTQEQITAFENKRAASAAAMADIMAKAAENAETLDKETADRYEAEKQVVKQCDEHIARLKEFAALQPAKAKPVTEDDTEPAPVVRKTVPAGEGVLRANVNTEKGIGLARYVKAVAFGHVNNSSPLEYAKRWMDSTPEVFMALKAATNAGTTTDATWAGPLVYAENLASEFLEYLRPQTILGKLNGVRRVPFNIRYAIQDGGSTVAWVGQGAPKPVSELSFTSGTLGFAKAAGIVVITEELARFSSPAAETVIRDDLAAQMRYFLDVQFIDPGVAAVANVSPASVLNGASNVVQASAWTSQANVVGNIFTLLNTFSANEIDVSGGVWIMTPEVALKLALIMTAGGETRAFPDVTPTGGTLLGFPVIVSNAVPHSTSAGSIVAFIVPNQILLADDGGVSISVSREASLQMDTAPTVNSVTPTATSLVSLWQTNSVGIRAERVINWARRRTYGVGYIDNVHTS